jgi:hypothetical protein
MRSAFKLLLAGACAIVYAQDPPGADQVAVDGVNLQERPCVPAGNSTQARDADSGPLENQAEGAAGGFEPCEEEFAEPSSGEDHVSGEAPDETAAGSDANPKEVLDAEASADDVFQPGDEISEDYPVPLPSDI